MQPDSTDTPPLESFRSEPALPPPIQTAPIIREPFWHYSDVFLFVGLSLVFLVGVGVLVHALYGNASLKQPPGTLLLGLQLLLYVAFYGVGELIFRLRYNKPLLPSLGWRRTYFKPAIAGATGAVLAFLVSFIAAALHTPKIPTPIDQLVDSPSSFVLFALTAIGAAPFFEEFLFRGLLQPLFSRTFGVIAGVVITAALFGAAHGYEYLWAWQYMLAIFLAGAVFGFARARANSIIPPIIMHCCYNSVFLVAYAVTKHGQFQ